MVAQFKFIADKRTIKNFLLEKQSNKNIKIHFCEGMALYNFPFDFQKEISVFYFIKSFRPILMKLCDFLSLWMAIHFRNPFGWNEVETALRLNEKIREF